MARPVRKRPRDDAEGLDKDESTGSIVILAVTHEWALRSGKANRKAWPKAQVGVEAGTMILSIMPHAHRGVKLHLEGCTLHHSRVESGLLGIRCPKRDEHYLLRGPAESMRTLFCDILACTNGCRKFAGHGSSERHLRQRYSELPSAARKDGPKTAAASAQQRSTEATQPAQSQTSQGDSCAADTSPMDLLTEEQREICRAVLAGKSIFFTGGAGTGKSFLLKKMLEMLRPSECAVTASTAMAASLLGGTTLHRWAGIGLGEGDVLSLAKKLKNRRDALQRWRQCKTLVIDEISMVDGRLFQVLEVLAQAIRERNAAFGGLQVVACGDFLQLPPVVRNEETDKKGRGPTFCFEVNAWNRTIQENFELTEIFRQKGDSTFCALLNEVRFANLSEQFFDVLQNRLVAGSTPFDPACEVTRLMPLRSEVDAMNERALSRLVGELVCMEARDDGNTTELDSFSGARRVIELRVGALVVLTRTIDVFRKLVNGSQGRVVRFEGAGSFRQPVVNFKDAGVEMPIAPMAFEAKCGNRIVGVRMQVPLELGWAMSIHKSQGLSLGNVEVNIRTVFENSQAYVALSRARTLSGLVLVGDDKDLRKCIRADPRCIEFHQQVSRTAAARKAAGSQMVLASDWARRGA